MCELVDNISLPSVKVYKIVAKHNNTGTFHSLAMGFKYKYGNVPVIKEQKALGLFRENLLTTNFSANMIGRTAGFLDFEDAKCLYEKAMNDFLLPEYSFAIIKITLSSDLIFGTYLIDYGKLSAVIGGRVIQSMEECDV